MEVSVYNIKGEDTGRKVVLNDAIFGVEYDVAHSSAETVYNKSQRHSRKRYGHRRDEGALVTEYSERS